MMLVLPWLNWTWPFRKFIHWNQIGFPWHCLDWNLTEFICVPWIFTICSSLALQLLTRSRRYWTISLVHSGRPPVQSEFRIVVQFSFPLRTFNRGLNEEKSSTLDWIWYKRLMSRFCLPVAFRALTWILAWCVWPWIVLTLVIISLSYFLSFSTL